MKKLYLFAFAGALSVFNIAILSAQSPGVIVRTGVSGTTALDPNGNGYSSLTTAGFTTSDVAQSEVPYKKVPLFFGEPIADLKTGQNGSFTEIVVSNLTNSLDSAGFYAFFDGGNILFRLRIGGVSSGSKGYSILIDTDERVGNKGPQADPNFVGATTTGNGNAGFEYEVIYRSGFEVSVYNIDGTIAPALIASYPNNYQISTALSTQGNDPDYFYDFYVPLTAFGSGITATTKIRMIATTVSSPKSAIQANRSDVYGVNDLNYESTNDAWTTVAQATPAVTLNDLRTGGSGFGGICTAPPVLNSPILNGVTSVSGTWTRADATKRDSATIKLYRISAGTATLLGSTKIVTGTTWTISGLTIGSGDVLYAKAVATGESECLQSNNVTASCSSNPAAPVVSCANSKGLSGTVAAGATVEIYQITTANNSAIATPLSSGLVVQPNGTFNYYGTNSQSGNACQGQQATFTAGSTVMLITNLSGCKSAPVIGCIPSGGSSSSPLTALSANTIALIGPIYPFHTSVSGTVAGSTSVQVLRLFVNGEYKAAVSVPANAITFTFTGLTLQASDALRVYAQTATTTCMTVSSQFSVVCYNQPPVITADANSQITSTATSISGTSSYTSGTVTLYRGTSPSGTSVGTGTIGSNGAWTVPGLTLTAGQSYYATLVTPGCATASASSSAISIAAAGTVCPVITGSYTEGATPVTGTVNNLAAGTGTVNVYLDDVLIGTIIVAITGTSIIWNASVLSGYSLYYGGVLRATYKTATSTESTGCSPVAVGCASPAIPGFRSLPSPALIFKGQSVMYKIGKLTANTWYSVSNAVTGVSYAPTAKSAGSVSGTDTLTITTNTFANPGTYNVKIAADPLTGCPASFATASISVLDNIVTPLRLIDFKGRWSDGTVILDWTTASEANSSHFEVERSADGTSFEKIGEKAAAGVFSGAAYSFTDFHPLATNYYRLKIVDSDGKFAYGTVVRIAENSFIGTVQPNPFTGKLVIGLNLTRQQTVKIELTDAGGRQVMQKTITGSRGLNTIRLNGLESCADGLYFIRILADDAVWERKLTKQALK